MPVPNQDLDLEIAQMHRESRRQTLRQTLRTAALFVSGGAGGLVGLVFFGSEILAVMFGIAATAFVARLQNNRNR